MSDCQPITDLQLDSKSRAALKRIQNDPHLGNALATIMSAGVLANIFVKSSSLQAAYNISQTDWMKYAHSMRAVPKIVHKAIENEARGMMVYYQIHYNQKLFLFWKGIYDGCN